mmetsp:Transcript_30810/g.73196  ORF Transcript_30810/g.73196 Transcript_30810/m.73196 type:complete len:210 (-) Transcript_30810:1049-1678(-)
MGLARRPRGRPHGHRPEPARVQPIRGAEAGVRQRTAQLPRGERRARGSDAIHPRSERDEVPRARAHQRGHLRQGRPVRRVAAGRGGRQGHPEGLCRRAAGHDRRRALPLLPGDGPGVDEGVWNERTRSLPGDRRGADRGCLPRPGAPGSAQRRHDRGCQDVLPVSSQGDRLRLRSLQAARHAVPARRIRHVLAGPELRGLDQVGAGLRT